MNEHLAQPIAALTHPLLDTHRVIAWDMDGTLVDGPNSEFFRAYILAHPEKEHHIVTFRTGPAQNFEDVEFWHEECVFELHHHGVPHGTIKQIHAMPDALYNAWAIRRSILQEQEVAKFLEWKGKTAAEIGATVMVDDMEGMVRKGCVTHGVTFVHAHDRAFSRIAA